MLPEAQCCTSKLISSSIGNIIRLVPGGMATALDMIARPKVTVVHETRGTASSPKQE